jgi:aminoglycoside 3-N-acetyltransferase
MKIPLPTPLKRRIKGRLKKWRLAWLRHRYAFGPEQFACGLRQLGLAAGDTVMVHSSMDCFAVFNGRPTEIIAELDKIVGPTGTLVMPTIPFAGSSLDWVGSGNIFDNRLTPSRMGLLTELFRRSPGVLRSQHPTHAVAARGAGAEALCRNHHLAATPCGEDSPYHGLLAADGSILLLGTGMESMTFFHALEEILADKMPFFPFTEKIYSLKSRNANGEMVLTKTRLYDLKISRRRRISRMTSQLQSQPGRWRQVRLGNMEMILLKARDVLAAGEEMAARGEFCYTDA